MALKIFRYDSYLKEFKSDIELRMNLYQNKRNALVKDSESLADFANGYLYYGLHKTEDGYVFREWAPGADEMHLIGDFNNWDRLSHPMKNIGNGVYEIKLTEKDGMKEGQKYKITVTHCGETKEHIPSYATYVVQDADTYVWCPEIHFSDDFEWHDADFKAENPPVIYECHIGMATEEYKVGTYLEFRDKVLPWVKKSGYNTIQIMAVMEHPYYASFGYQVSNFFAAASRFGTPEELKMLIDTAHQMGIRVLLDIVHSHAVGNEAEGLNKLDGTSFQYFHEGAKGDHSAWGTKLFNYGKNEVLHFLLSNVKFWMTEYHFDGFRFDGVTSMLYQDHGLGSSFDNYSKYFSMNTDTEAVTYLMLANELIHSMNKRAITIAEDMSGMPGMCLPIKDGGIGFDYRLSMGLPDLWIRLLKERKDEDWDMWQLWYEMTNRRPHEKTIGYAESHDQALVGDKTIMFRLCDADMYWAMSNLSEPSMTIDRGIALHKMIRLITYSLAGEGYLNFMGNEFGHPEWIDFPREGNGWSYHYARRQWSLKDDMLLKYHYLSDFDQAMVKLGRRDRILQNEAHNLFVHNGDQVLVYEKHGDVFVFNFNPERSFTGYLIPVPEEGKYKVTLTTDDKKFGGFDRIDKKVVYETKKLEDGRYGILLYLPNRAAIVLKKK